MGIVLLYIVVGSICGFIWFMMTMLFFENTDIGEALSDKIVRKIKGGNNDRDN